MIHFSPIYQIVVRACVCVYVCVHVCVERGREREVGEGGLKPDAVPDVNCFPKVQSSSDSVSVEFHDPL